MSFTSFNFILYFPILITCYWVVPKKYQRSLLLISSYLFYFNIKPIFSLLLMYVTSCTYIFALLMENTLEESKKSKYLIVSIFLILLPLVFYKYFGPINDVMKRHWMYSEHDGHYQKLNSFYLLVFHSILLSPSDTL